MNAYLNISVAHTLCVALCAVLALITQTHYTQACVISCLALDTLVVTGNEHSTSWASDTLVIGNSSTTVKLTFPHAKINALPSSSGTLALTSYSGYAVGAIIMYSGANPPSSFLKCNGQTISRSTYAQLFTVIDTKYGAGNGSTTFSLPNMSHPVLSYAIRYE
jgi:hypothetical protein